MKKALISPNELITYISAWTEQVPPEPIYTTVPNGERVAEVVDNTFEIAQPLFWVDCDDAILADQWYYDSATATFVVTPQNVPQPQPVVEGAQSL